MMPHLGCGLYHLYWICFYLYIPSSLPISQFFCVFLPGAPYGQSLSYGCWGGCFGVICGRISWQGNLSHLLLSSYLEWTWPLSACLPCWLRPCRICPWQSLLLSLRCRLMDCYKLKRFGEWYWGIHTIHQTGRWSSGLHLNALCLVIHICWKFSRGILLPVGLFFRD